MGLIEVTIPNWGKFNARADRSNFSWFRFENTFFHDQAVFGLPDSARVLYIFLLCEASKKNKATVTLRPEYIAAILGRDIEAVQDDVNKLHDLELVAASCHQTVASRHQTVASSRHDDTVKEKAGGVTPSYIQTDSTDNTVQTRQTVPAAQTKTARSSEAKTHASWEAFRHAYASRYGTAPIRSAKVNAQLSKLVDYLGATEAPQVIEFFLTHNSSYYAQKGHDLGLLLTDYQKLRTEWITGRQITTAQARSTEAKQHNAQVVREWLEKKQAGEGATG
jgi:hypothetical protein